MISDLHCVHGVFETPRQLNVRFAHAPRVRLTLEARAEYAVVPVVARVIRLTKDNPSRARYRSVAQPSLAR